MANSLFIVRNKPLRINGEAIYFNNLLILLAILIDPIGPIKNCFINEQIKPLFFSYDFHPTSRILKKLKWRGYHGQQQEQRTAGGKSSFCVE